MSYTNECLESAALYSLERWICSAYTEARSNLSKLSHPYEYLADMYLSMIRREESIHDADLQVGLGVLFNLTYEHDKAADCFRTALQLRPYVSTQEMYSCDRESFDAMTLK